MKTEKRIIMIAAAVLLVAVLTGCSFMMNLFNIPLSIEARVLSFQDSINSSNRKASNILANFGPEDLMEQYDNAKELDYWELAFPSDIQYTFLVTSQSDTEAVIVGATKEDSNGNLLAATSYSFRMYEEENGNWLIREIYEDPEGNNSMLIRKIK